MIMGWHHYDLTAAAGAPEPAGLPNGYMFNADPNFPQCTQHVVYMSSGGHVLELYWVPD
jgi:hypothetical protein